MTRRALGIALLAAGVALGDAAADVWDLFASMASALAQERPADPRLPPVFGNAEAFLKAVDRQMSGYDQLSANIRAMVQEAHVESDILPVTNDGGDQERTVVLDWTLRMKRPTADRGGQIDTREQMVTFHVKKQGKKWRVTSIDPLGFFSPPNYR